MRILSEMRSCCVALARPVFLQQIVKSVRLTRSSQTLAWPVPHKMEFGSQAQVRAAQCADEFREVFGAGDSFEFAAHDFLTFDHRRQICRFGVGTFL